MQPADKEPALPQLPNDAHLLLVKITGGESLGASRNIRQINDLFETIAEQSPTSTPESLIATLIETGDYLIATRGRNTPAIANAIQLMLKGLENESPASVADVRQLVAQRREEYNTESLRNRKLLAEYGANLLANSETILAYDYSSTMMAILEELADRGRQVHLIVPESRSLDGGRPISNEATDIGHTASFIIDAAFHHFLHKVDAVLIGAETIFADGDCWNTVGSYPIAVLAKKYQVPYYVATELIKIAPQSFTGRRRGMQPFDYASILNYPDGASNSEAVSVVAPDLDNVPGSLITSYVTQRGILLPEHIRGESKRFLDSIGGTTLKE